MTTNPSPALTPADALNAQFYAPSSPQKFLRAEDFIPKRYILQIEPRECRCGEKHESYSCFLVKEHPSGGVGGRMTTAVAEMLMSLPVGTARAKPKQIPFCIKCWEKWSGFSSPTQPTTEEGWRAAREAQARLDAEKAKLAAARRESATRVPINIHNIEIPE